MKKIYIRVDGNEIIATGHVMRCLSIAGALRSIGMEVVFVVADARPKEMIEQRGFKMDVLGTVWNDLDREIEIFCEYLIQNQVSILLLDTYFVTNKYLEAISKHTQVVYIDDLLKFDYTVDTIIHYSPFANIREYWSLYGNQKKVPHILCGGAYIPLREEFAYEPYEVRDAIGKVLITTGGTDQLNVAGNLMKRFLVNPQLNSLEYHIIIGCFHCNREALYQLADEHKNVHIHENVQNMSLYMRSCDVAISAGGTTLYELCACGIPAICLEVADNQAGAKVWQQEDYMEYAGNAFQNMSGCVDYCERALVRYRKDTAMRKRRSHRMQQLVDGNGAKRIAEYIVNMEGQRC